MISENHNLRSELEGWFSEAKRVVIAGIGNPIRMDDFVGVKIVQDLRGKVSEKVCLIECESVPENFIKEIVDFNPTHILLIDAAILGLNPGNAKLVFPENLEFFQIFSTHFLPLRLFCDYIMENTDARIALLLIQPKRADFGEGLTDEVSSSAGKIVNLLVEILP